MNYSNDQLIEKFGTIPEELQEAIIASDLSDKINSIGTKHSLHIDQIGLLGEITNYALLGLLPLDKFPEEVKNKLMLNDLLTEAVVRDINQSVFLSIRQYLASHQTEEKNTGVIEPSKDTILSEIENPVPVEHPISVARGFVPEPSKDPVSKDFVAGKLSETVEIPAQKMNPEPPKAPEKPKGYSSDPYREPIA